MVIAIISILAALLMPALKQARDQAKAIGCVNKLKQIGAAVFMYGKDNEDYYPVMCYPDVAQPAELTFSQLPVDGGGILIIPPAVPQNVTIYNRSQDKRESGAVASPAVTIIDRRAGYDREMTPPIGRWSMAGWVGKEISRVLNFQGPGFSSWGSSYPMTLRNLVVHGTSSYLHPTSADAPKGKDSRVYVHTIRGIFVGQHLNNYIGPVYEGGFEPVTVKSIGWDSEKKRAYFTADLEKDHKASAFLSNKNVVGSLSIDASLNADQQTSGELSVIRKQYAHGDSFLINGMFIYQGDILTQMGDEGGMVYNAEISQDPNPFFSKVETVNLDKDEIKFAPGVSNLEKLASSRPLINMNSNKWITTGTVKVVPPDNWGGYMIQDPSFDLEAGVKNGIDLKNFSMTRTPKEGEDFAVKGWGGAAQYENLYKGKKVIPTVLNWDGIPIKKFKYPYNGRAYPSLHVKGYNRLGGRIIPSADCGWTSDVVGRYFAIADEGEILYPEDKSSGGSYPVGGAVRRIYRWYPITDFWKNADGTCGIQLGRVRMFAGGAGAPNFYNEDNYTWDGHERPLKYIIAPGAMVYDVSDGWKDAYGGGSVPSDPRTIRVAANSDRGTKLDFAPGDPIDQAIGADPAHPKALRVRLWNNVPDNMEEGNATISLINHGRVASRAGFSLSGTGKARGDVADRKDRKPPFVYGLTIDCVTQTGIQFGGDVTEAALLFAQPHAHEQPIKWLHENGESTLIVDPLSGDMRVRGSDLDVAAVKGARGLSATTTAANNLRGINVAVPKGAKEIVVKFEKSEADDRYSLNAQPNWMTQDAVTEKTATGFKVVFGTPAGDAAKIDWQLIR